VLKIDDEVTDGCLDACFLFSVEFNPQRSIVVKTDDSSFETQHTMIVPFAHRFDISITNRSDSIDIGPSPYAKTTMRQPRILPRLIANGLIGLG
jgi:hypothetical protein